MEYPGYYGNNIWVQGDKYPGYDSMDICGKVPGYNAEYSGVFKYILMYC